MTLQEIQYKAQGIIHKWRDDDSAPYIEFVEELAHMIVPEPSEDLGEAAENHIRKVADTAGHPGWDWTTQDIAEAFIAGAEWQADHTPLPEDTVIWNDGFKTGREVGSRDMKEQMMRDAVKWLVDDDYDDLTDKGKFILGSVGIGYNGYYIPYSDLLKLPKENEK